MPYYYHLLWATLAISAIPGCAGYLLFLSISRSNPGDARLVEASVKLRKATTALRLEHERIAALLVGISALLCGWRMETYDFRYTAACAVGGSITLFYARFLTTLQLISSGRIAAAIRKSDEASHALMNKIKASNATVFIALAILSGAAWAFLGEGTSPSLCAGAATVALTLALGAGIRQDKSGEEDRNAMETAIAARDFAVVAIAFFCAQLVTDSLPWALAGGCLAAVIVSALRSTVLARSIGATAFAAATAAGNDPKLTERVRIFFENAQDSARLPAILSATCALCSLALIHLLRGWRITALWRGEFIIFAIVAAVIHIALRKAPVNNYRVAALVAWAITGMASLMIVWNFNQTAGLGWATVWCLSTIPAVTIDKTLPVCGDSRVAFQCVLIPAALAASAFTVVGAW